MELIQFINTNTPLTSKPILTEFINKYPMQNNGILGTDIMKFVQLYTNDVSLVEDNNYRIITKGVLIYIMNGSHMFYLYNNEEEHVLEKWDPATFQRTTNNCTLYAGILAVVRPLLTFEATIQLIKRILDAPNTESAQRLAVISKHFFARDISCFKYGIGNIIDYVVPTTVKPIEKQHIGSCLELLQTIKQSEKEKQLAGLDDTQKLNQLITLIKHHDKSVYVLTDDVSVYGFVRLIDGAEYLLIDGPYRRVVDAADNNIINVEKRLLEYVINNKPDSNIRIYINSNNSRMKLLLSSLKFTCSLSNAQQQLLLYEFKR